MRDNLNWGRIKAWVAPSADSGEDEEEEYMGPDQQLEELIMLLEEKDTSTPHTQSLVGHTPIPTRREAINITLVSPGKAPPPPLPPSSPASETRSCPKTILESSAMGQWLAVGRPLGQFLQLKTQMRYKHPQTPSQQKVQLH